MRKLWNSPKNILEKIDRLRWLKLEAAKISQEAEELKEDIVYYMGNQEELKDNHGHTLCTYRTHVRETFDSKSFKNDHVEIYKLYIKQTQSKVFLLK